MPFMHSLLELHTLVHTLLVIFISHLAGLKCFNALHEDDAGNALGHVMHSPAARALHDLEHYPHHPRAPALKHEGQLSVI